VQRIAFNSLIDDRVVDLMKKGLRRIVRPRLSLRDGQQLIELLT